MRGEVRLQGARGSALPLLAATVLAPGTSVLRNVPLIGDVAAMRRVLESLGCVCEGDRVVRVDAAGLGSARIDYAAVRSLRAAVLLLGPLLARVGEARVPLPGSSSLGARPIDEHLRGLEALGARVRVEHGDVVARARRLRGASIRLAVPTVGGTESLMMAAAQARGRTQIDNAAREPEVEELARVLVKMGARIEGAGTGQIIIEGVEALSPFEHALPPDRIEAGTLLVAAALTHGDVVLGGALPEQLDPVVTRLRAAGAEVEAEVGGLRARGPAWLQPLDVSTAPHPGFPTDLGPAFTVLAARARGQSVISEGVFDGRFGHVGELRRMGVDLQVQGRVAVVRGPSRLSGAHVRTDDMRAASALCLAGLVAEGETELELAEVLDGGYERFDAKLRSLGADVERVECAA